MPKKPAAAAKPLPKAPAQRGRKPLSKAEPTGPQLDADKLAQRNQELVVMGDHHRAVIDQFGDGLPYIREIYIADNQRDIRVAAEAAVRVGRRLVVMKEHEPHGEWMHCLEEMGLSADTAQRMMAAARRLAGIPNAAHARHLIEAAKTQTRLFDLLSLPEAEFQELAIEGETGGLKRDELGGMTRNELREAIREIKADVEAKDQRITKLSEDLNKAEEKASKAARHWKKATPDEQLATLLEQAQSAASHVSLAIAQGSEEAGLSGALAALVRHAEQHDLNVAEQVGGILANLINELRLVRDGDDVQAPVIMDQPYRIWRSEAGLA